MDEDYLLAIQLQEQFDLEASQPAQSHGGWDGFGQSHNDRDGFGQSSKKQTFGSGRLDVIPYSRPPEKPLSLVDESWETLDPSPDVRAMFLEFNAALFWGKLSGVEVKWSPKMTLCAGVCSYEGRGGLCSIRLSEPLLKLRPRRDLVQTLLHEMIHALLFVTQNNRDRDGHGPEFCKHMNRINDATGTKITVYHSFHDEVDLYRTHWWRCNGPCRDRKPYFGYVKRSMNRPPQPADSWWMDHQQSCGGTYTKVKEPEGYGKKDKTLGGGGGKGKMAADKKPLVSSADKKPSVKTETPRTSPGSGLQDIRNLIPFSGKGFVLGGRSQPPPVSPPKPKLPLPSPPTKDARSPGWSLLKANTSKTTTGGARGPPKKSVGNTKVFANINGSPVRINKPTKWTKTTDSFKGKQSSVQDLFNARGLKTSPSTASSSTVSKPPDEITGASRSSTVNGSNFFKQPKNTTSSTNMTGASKTSSSTISKPPDETKGTGTSSAVGGSNYFKQPKITTSATSRASATTSTSSSTTSTSSSSQSKSSGGNPGSSGPSSSRKRPWDDSISSQVFDFFDKTMSSSKRSREDGASTGAASSYPSSSSASSSYPSSSSSSGPAAQLSSGAPASLMVSCPVCQAQVPQAKINEHLDSCLC